MQTKRILVPGILAALLLILATGGHALASTCSSGADERALRILQQPPFPPRDVSLFTPQIYSEAPPMEPAAPYTVSEERLRQRLRGILARRFRGDREEVAAGLAVFDSAEIAAIVPDPRLRMGLALLKGTAGEAAIDAIASGLYEEVRFEDLGEGGIAQVVLSPGSPNLVILFNERYQYEDPRLMAATLAHEGLHQDPPVSPKEELISNAFDALIYGQVVLEAPTVARSKSELSRRANAKLMARLNSRDPAGRLRLFVAQGNVYPGGNPLANFAAAFGPLGADTPGNETLAAMLREVTGKRIREPDFDDATLSLLDRRQELFCPAELIRLARILRLDVTPRSSWAHGTSDDAAPELSRAGGAWRELLGGAM
jgi:hypothetical protein